MKNHNVGYRGPYLERNGENAKEMVDILVMPPERPLNEAEKAEAKKFEANLADIELADGQTVEKLLRYAKAESVVAPMMFTAPFLDGAIHSDKIQIPTFETDEDVEFWMCELVADEQVDRDELRKILDESTKKCRAKIAEAVANGEPIDDSEANSMSMVLEPKKAIATAMDLTEARQKLKELRMQYGEDAGDNLDGAKRAIVDVYLSKVNEQIATSVPILEYLATQTGMVGDLEMQNAALDSMPASIRKAIEDENQGKVFRRLDYLRNGIGAVGEGKASVVSGRIEAVVEESQNNMDDEKAPRYSPEQVKKLKSFMVQPAEIEKHIKSILNMAGKLSQDAPTSVTEVLTRSGRAPDGLFQVVRKGSTFSVESSEGYVVVPDKERSLWDVMTVGGMHELEHLNQAEAEHSLEGKSLRIAQTKGKRVSIIREAAADYKQRQYETELSGKSKEFNLNYAVSLKTLEEGGGLIDAVRASFDERMRKNPDLNAKKTAENAVDSTLRLVRMGGMNSQPMVYVEEAILLDEMKNMTPEERERVGSVTSLNFSDQVKLHRYGLLEAGDEEAIDWKPYIEAEFAGIVQEVVNG